LDSDPDQNQEEMAGIDLDEREENGISRLLTETS